MHIHAVILCASLAAAVAGCHREPVIDTGERPADVGGTIAGSVRSEGGSPLGGRTVTATDTSSGQTFEESTAPSGGFTIKVPAGTYRLDVGLREGETLATRPDTTEVNVGDLDGQRDFVVAAR
jgi:hypothetical protein